MHCRNLLLVVAGLVLIAGPLMAAIDVSDTQVKIYFDNKQQLHELRGAGLDIVKTTPEFIEVITNPGELENLAALGYRTEVVHESLTEFYISRLPHTATPQDMGGYKTLAEIEASMTLIASNYPSIVSGPTSIGATHEGRDLWAVKISDNPGVDEDEPEVLFTAAIHAREVITPELMLTYMEWLTSNYGVDPTATELVDTREIWFVPVVNPDGYYHNQVIAPSGGGMWRKNRRDNGDGSRGVDLNRNFGYEFGFDDEGSSPYPSSETYRGPSGFSEPETQAMRDFELAHDFVLSCYYHSYSDIFIYPWGYARIKTPDQDIFAAMGDTIQGMNGYIPGTGWELLYTTNGGSDDWEYGEQTLKNKCYGTTIEIGTDADGFWPSLSRKPVLVAENMGPIKFLTRVAGYIETLGAPLPPTVSVPGQVDGGGYTINLIDNDPDNPAVVYELRELQNARAVLDPGDDLNGWTTNDWSVAASGYNSLHSFYSGAENNSHSYLQTVYPYDVQNGDTLSFMTYLDLEFYYDFAYVEVSTDGENFTSIPGTGTSNYNPYGGNMGNGITGSSGAWVEVHFDLSAYAGQQVYFRIVCQTDDWTLGFGMYIDDIYPHVLFQSETVLATDLAETSFDVTDRPIGVYYYEARTRDAQNQWSPFSTLIRTDVLAEDLGDADLDGIKNSIADLVLFNLFMQYGLGAFDIYQEQQVAETDFNCDELPLSIADQIVLNNLVVGVGEPCYATTPAPHGTRPGPETAAQSGQAPVYSVELQSTTFETGDSAWVDIMLTQGDSSLLGYQFHLEYDVASMTLASARLGDDLSNWGFLEYDEQSSEGLNRLQVAAVAAAGVPLPGPEDLDPSNGPMNLARLVFTFDAEIALTHDLNFVWVDCGDNVIVVGGYVESQLKPSRLVLSKHVYDADLVDITGADVYGGADFACGDGLFGGTPIPAIDFTSGRVTYDPSCCVGHTGDVNNDGVDEPTLGDISYLIDFLYITGSGTFDCLAEADVNQSGGANPTIEEITLGDISRLIDHLFITEAELPLCY